MAKGDQDVKDRELVHFGHNVPNVILDSTKSHFGILFSKQGITGEEKTTDAEREQLKVFQDRGMVIVVINQTDLEYVSNGGNFISLLRQRYEKIRLDLRK